MKLTALILTSLLALTAVAVEAPSDMDLFLLIGQSNMAGRGKVEPMDEITNPKILMLTKDRKWVPAKDPVHFDKPIAGVGLCSQFARTVLKTKPDTTIGLVPCAVGGTSLNQWKPGGALYKDALARTREAMKRGKLAGILWHQGESDSAPEKVASYGKSFADMIAQLRKELGAESVPLIIGELGHFRDASKPFNAALPDIARAIPDCALVSADDLSDKGDKLHFGTAALRTFGERYAEAYLTLKRGQSAVR